MIARLGLSLVPEGRHIFGTLDGRGKSRRSAATSSGDRPRPRQRQQRLLELFPRLAERLRYPAGRLSGGEQQMLAIARAVMTKPRRPADRRAVARSRAQDHRPDLRNPARSAAAGEPHAADQRAEFQPHPQARRPYLRAAWRAHPARGPGRGTPGWRRACATPISASANAESVPAEAAA